MATFSSPVGTGGYEDFYGLRTCPFDLKPDTRMVFESQSYSTTLDDTLVAIRAHTPLIIVIGDIGAGKTLYCRALAERLPNDALLSACISSPASGEAFLAQVASDLGASLGVSASLFDTSRRGLLGQCHDLVDRIRAEGSFAVIIVDDAHELPPEAFDDIHELLGRGAGEVHHLQVILVGRPELEVLFERPEPRHLAQYDTARLVLRPLRDDEIGRYVDRRLWVAQDGSTFCLTEPAAQSSEGGRLVRNAGAPFWNVRFAASAIRGVALLSNGIPLLVNLVCDRALLSGLAHRKRRIGTRQVLAAARDLQLPVPLGLRLAGTARYFALSAVCLSLAVVVWRVGILSANSGPDDGGSRVDTLPPPAAALVEVVGPLEETDGFLIAVARFQTEDAATAVTDRLLELGLPAFARVTASGSQEVVVGPYVSLDEAEDTRLRLTVENLSVSEIVSVTRTPED